MVLGYWIVAETLAGSPRWVIRATCHTWHEAEARLDELKRAAVEAPVSLSMWMIAHAAPGARAESLRKPASESLPVAVLAHRSGRESLTSVKDRQSAGELGSEYGLLGDEAGRT